MRPVLHLDPCGCRIEKVPGLVLPHGLSIPTDRKAARMAGAMMPPQVGSAADAVLET